MARYLVTGAAGFIGSHLVEYLVRTGEDVSALDNFSTGHRRNIEPWLSRINFIEGDLCSLDDCKRAVEGVTYVLHQAAIPSVSRSIADPMASHQANVTGTLNLLLAARDAGVKRVVYAGSSSAYGDQTGDRKQEMMCPAPLSPYAVSKLSCEYYLAAFSRCYGLETITLRYFNVFGPRQDPNSPYSAVIPLFITAFLRGESPCIHGDGTQTRDFTFVENNVRANILAATASVPAQGEVYNIACGESHSILDPVEKLKKILQIDVAPRFADARVGDVKHSKADISRAVKELGYVPSVSFEEGLRRTVTWYKNLIIEG